MAITTVHKRIAIFFAVFYFLISAASALRQHSLRLHDVRAERGFVTPLPVAAWNVCDLTGADSLYQRAVDLSPEFKGEFVFVLPSGLTARDVVSMKFVANVRAFDWPHKRFMWEARNVAENKFVPLGEMSGFLKGYWKSSELDFSGAPADFVSADGLVSIRLSFLHSDDISQVDHVSLLVITANSKFSNAATSSLRSTVETCECPSPSPTPEPEQPSLIASVTRGYSGTAVTLTGQDFSGPDGTVKYRDAAARLLLWTPTQVVIGIPSNAAIGAGEIQLFAAGVVIGSVGFEVIPAEIASPSAAISDAFQFMKTKMRAANGGVFTSFLDTEDDDDGVYLYGHHVTSEHVGLYLWVAAAMCDHESFEKTYHYVQTYMMSAHFNVINWGINKNTGLPYKYPWENGQYNSVLDDLRVIKGLWAGFHQWKDERYRALALRAGGGLIEPTSSIATNFVGYPDGLLTGLGFDEQTHTSHTEDVLIPINYSDLWTMTWLADNNQHHAERWHKAMASAVRLMMAAQLPNGQFLNCLLRSTGQLTGDWEYQEVMVGEVNPRATHIKTIQSLWTALHLARTRFSEPAQRALNFYKTVYDTHGSVSEYYTFNGVVPSNAQVPGNLQHGEARIYGQILRLALYLNDTVFAERILSEKLLPLQIRTVGAPIFGAIGANEVAGNADSYNTLEALLALLQHAGSSVLTADASAAGGGSPIQTPAPFPSPSPSVPPAPVVVPRETVMLYPKWTSALEFCEETLAVQDQAGAEDTWHAYVEVAPHWNDWFEFVLPGTVDIAEITSVRIRANVRTWDWPSQRFKWALRDFANSMYTEEKVSTGGRSGYWQMFEHAFAAPTTYSNLIRAGDRVMRLRLHLSHGSDIGQIDYLAIVLGLGVAPAPAPNPTTPIQRPNIFAYGNEVCGNGYCGEGEVCRNCPQDRSCTVNCGNGVCDTGGTYAACPGDCKYDQQLCGDGFCQWTENSVTCCRDCGNCASCGNGVCEASEGCFDCPQDCGACTPICGDAQCNGAETCSTCARDCGACKAIAGNMHCEYPENCETHAGDCGVCPTYTNTVEWRGNRYAVLENTAPTSDTIVYSCSPDGPRVPPGWRIAEYSQDVKDLFATGLYRFGTKCVMTAEDIAIDTTNGQDCLNNVELIVRRGRVGLFPVFCASKVLIQQGTIASCEDNCHGHGSCDGTTGRCVCDDNWTGVACDRQIGDLRVPSLVGKTWWHPEKGATWQWQLQGQVDRSYDVAIYDIDFDQPKAVFKALHEDGRKVICYFSAGSSEDWRIDIGLFPSIIKGGPLWFAEGDVFHDEAWLDIRRLDIVGPIMLDRLDMAIRKGCDGIEYDNPDGFDHEHGLANPLSYEQQLVYNRWLAGQAHARGMAVVLKNSIRQVHELKDTFDGSVNEQMWELYDHWFYWPMLEANKPVLQAEYEIERCYYCARSNAMGASTIKKHPDLTACMVDCTTSWRSEHCGWFVVSGDICDVRQHEYADECPTDPAIDPKC